MQISHFAIMCFTVIRPVVKQTCLSERILSHNVRESAIKKSLMPRVVTVCDRMCDTKVMFKCETTVTLCVLHAGSPFRAFPSQCVRCRSEKISVIWPLPG